MSQYSTRKRQFVQTQLFLIHIPLKNFKWKVSQNEHCISSKRDNNLYPRSWVTFLIGLNEVQDFHENLFSESYTTFDTDLKRNTSLRFHLLSLFTTFMKDLEPLIFFLVTRDTALCFLNAIQQLYLIKFKATFSFWT